MRIRLHKSRTITSAFVAGILIVGGMSVAAPYISRSLNPDTVNQTQNNPPGQDGTPGQSLDPDHGNSCDAHRNNNNKNENGIEHGNGEAADCPYTLGYFAGDNGHIEGDTTQTVNQGADGTEVTAVADPGYRFSNWSDNNSSASRIETNVQIDISVTVSFDPVIYTFTYFASAGGSLSGATTQSVAFGNNGAPVTAVADAGNRFKRWSDGNTSNPRTDLNASGNINVSAIFETIPGGGGGGGGGGGVPAAPLATASASPSASPLPVAKIIVPKMTKMTTTYNHKRQGVTYTVEPSTSSCKVTYNGTSALPTNAGSYNVIIKCKDGKVTGGTTGTFVINKAQPVLTWSDPNAITTNNSLTIRELKARSDVPGIYEYSPAKGAVLSAGTHELNVAFTPNDTKNNLTAAAKVKILVTLATLATKKANKFTPIKVPFTMASYGLTAKTRPLISALFLRDNVEEVTVYGYVQPSKNKAADMKLSLQRAQTVAKQLKGISPSLKISIRALGATINSACKAEKNKCVIIK